MKLALIYLSICVAISQQQYFHPRMMMGYPWMSPFAQHPMYFNNYMGQYPYMGHANRYANDAQARVKGYEPLPEDYPVVDGEENRFLSGSSIGNPLLKTVTFTITSTCTALSVTTCVPISNLSPNPIACAGRRKRFAEFNDEQGENIWAQYPIIPNEVRIVMATAEPSTGLDRGVRESSPFGISSSIEEDSNDNKDKQFRDKRFFNWNAWATGVTVTSWSVVSSTFTSTLAIPGASTVLPCLPAGYGICQVQAGK